MMPASRSSPSTRNPMSSAYVWWLPAYWYHYVLECLPMLLGMCVNCNAHLPHQRLHQEANVQIVR